MSADPNPTVLHESEYAAALQPSAVANPVSTLAWWVEALDQDVSAVLKVCEQLLPAAPLRAPLRAGLRHLVHIYPLSEGIEALAMLEVALVLRVTALLAQPAEELGDETVLRLRAETGLIEELFPVEKDALWGFCDRLIAQEGERDGGQAVDGERLQTTDPLLERARDWARTYTAPVFGGHARELTRIAAFVKNRAVAWSA